MNRAPESRPFARRPTTEELIQIERQLRQERRQAFRMEIRTLMMLVALAAVVFWFVLDPMLGPLVLGLMLVVGVAIFVPLTAMGLGLLGFGLFALCDRALLRLKRARRWPDNDRGFSIAEDE